VIASQDLGALGLRAGEPLRLSCPPGDALRGIVGWVPLLLLLLLRKANRTRQIWAVLLPTLALYLVFGVAERTLNAYLVFHYHQYICSVIADLMRFLAVSLALVVAVADLLTPPWRWLRFLVLYFLLFLATNLQIASNAWPFLSASAWTAFFAVFLLIFLTGHGVVTAVLRHWVGAERFRTFYAGFCVVAGTVPLLILAAVEWKLSRSMQLSSTTERFRIIVVLASALSLPWLVYSGYVLLAARNSVCGERLTRAFGLPLAERKASPEFEAVAALTR
jgi:hypothetical protein